MEFKNLLMETSGNVATLTVNRPRSMNVLNSEVLEELECALHELNLDTGVKAVVLTGAGERAFVAGADIKEMAGMNATQGHAFARKGQQVMLLMERMEKAVIAAVNGYALGGGLELALACDFVYASSTARLGFPEVTLGIMPGFGGTQNLARLIGPNRANEMIFTGRMLDADKACAWGIVNEVFPPEELLKKALETARAIAQAAPLGVKSAKDAIANGLNMGKEEGFRYEAALFGVLFSTGDQLEGMGAFVEKRQAAFKGK